MGLTVFRFLGDLLHLASNVLLLKKMLSTGSCAGISLKSVELYAVVFVTRYVDMLWNISSMYNWLLKLFFLATTFTSIYVMRTRLRHTYDRNHDTFVVSYLLGPCAVLALIVCDHYSLYELVWTFSIILESVAILPQLFLLSRTREADLITAEYIFCLGSYRVLYLLNWMYRVFVEGSSLHWFVWVFGLVQSLLYVDFFYYFIRSKYYGVQKLRLPV